MMKKLLFTLMLLLTAVFTIAAQQTPPPEIVFTEDETGCEVRAVGQGEVHLFLDTQDPNGEVQNPYRISRPYKRDSYEFMACAQAEGQSESETVNKTIWVTPSPTIKSETKYDNLDTYSEEVLNDYVIRAQGMGDVRLFMDGNEVQNPYTVHMIRLNNNCKFTATAKMDGYLTGESQNAIEIAPMREQLVTVTSDEENYYVTATGDGYLSLEVYNRLNVDDYSIFREYGSGSVNVIIPKLALAEWYYVATRRTNAFDDLLGFDVGSFLMMDERLNECPFIYNCNSDSQYKIFAVPHYSFDFNTQTDHVQIQYGTQLMLDGNVVEEPYYIDRAEHDEAYNFSATSTWQYVRYGYLGCINGVEIYSVEPLETINVFSDTIKATVVVQSGGDNFFIDYLDYISDEATGEVTDGLLYEVNARKDTESDMPYPHHAVVQDNRDYTSGIAIVPDSILVYYYEMRDGEAGFGYYQVDEGCSYLYELYDIFWPTNSWGSGFTAFYDYCPVTAIADDAFLDNMSLTGVEIGKNVTSIGKDAFKGCSNLTDVTCWAMTPPTMTNVETFDEVCYSNATLRVPESSLDKYRNADWWRKFQHIEGVGSPGLPGDVNGDGELGIADINTLIDAILSSNTEPIYDINGDNEVTISDVMALIDMFLSSH